MKVQLSILAIVLLIVTACSNAKGNEADSKSTKQVTAVIDSLVASEPDMTIESIEVVNAKMPSVMADEVRPALEKSGEMIGYYIIAQAMGGSKELGDDFNESFVAIGAPLREAMKQYESEDHPEFVFGLTKLKHQKDSLLNERRIYIFDEDNLDSVKRVEKFPAKSANDIGILLGLAYGDQVDLKDKNAKFQDMKTIKENPILMFIVEDIK